jgi:hypothetical protein
MLNPDLQENPLFKNRRRVLAVPEVNQVKKTARSRTLVLNAGIVSLTIIFFGAGLWYGYPALFSPIGDEWFEASVKIFGADTGAVIAEKSPWILARVTGILAYLLLFASVALGLSTVSRLVADFTRTLAGQYLHRLLSLLALSFTAFHLIGLLLDTYLNTNIGQLLVPFGMEYRSLWNGLGTLGLYSMVIVTITAYMSSRFGYKVWKKIHFLSFGTFTAVLLHGLFSGTDSTSLWAKGMYLVTGITVAGLLGLRVVKRRKKPVSKRPIAKEVKKTGSLI